MYVQSSSTVLKLDGTCTALEREGGGATDFGHTRIEAAHRKLAEWDEQPNKALDAMLTPP